MIADPKEFLAESRVLQRRPVLIGDMGGTNARFALTAPNTEGDPVIWAIREFPVAEFSSLEALARHYLQEAGSPETERAVLAVASAVTGDRITITNHPWSFSIQALRRGLGIATLEVINDFAAIAAAIPYLEPRDLYTIGPQLAPRPCADLDGRFVILGPGTGLGVAGLCLQAGVPIVIESEGGHIGFAPSDAYELEVLKFLMRKFPRVSTERLVSGSGLQNLYAAVCAIGNIPATLTEPAAITAHADEMPESPAARAVELLCGVLGSFAGDVALAFGAWDGVYLTGGVTERLLPWLARGQFRARFEAKGRFETVLRAVPTRAITRAHIGLLGAAAKALPPVR